MMKKLLSLVFIALASSEVNSQILVQDFESATFPPTGWEAYVTNTGAGFTWTPNTVSPLQGLKDVSIAYDPALELQDESLLSPSFSLVNYSSVTLTFDVSLSYYWAVTPNDNYDVTVSVSTDGGFSWTDIWTEADQGVFTNFTKLPITEDLTSYIGNANCRIKVNYTGTDGAQAKFDNVVITGVLNTDSFFSQNFSIYPNPIESVVNLNSKNGNQINKVQILDLNGRLIKEVTPSGLSEIQVNVSNLNAGVYFVKVQSDLGVGTSKIIKK
jgi:hypothetical protein